ncbi:class I SAM-dependent methyltransferase [Paractinoplanes atraurantiacus]|uniref:Methyltransferase domain-containing protein n=1 Tax=Paractinoplanes atraurantiacus TaxID=1036182 RepID=A0A285IAC2_9ACTN|nr:methyltransferase domain-containing protein [Actinoplanes atraurantiacus]SNY44932.1 Methyltransferase domain-containing protein [Actinoplanes atraurantiacus]
MTIAYFDGVADTYDQILPFFTAFATQAVDHLGPAPGTRALDLAAGRGAFTAALLARGCRVTAVDGAPRMVELLRRDHADVDAHVRDAAHLELPPDTFHLVVCGFAIHIIADPRAALAEAIRVARPGATLAFTVPAPAPGPDPLIELYAEYRRFHADGCGRHGNDAEEADLFAASTLTDITATHVEVAIPVPDGETYWRWSRSHGSGRFIDGLPADRRAEMHTRLLARLAEIPDFVLHRSATLWTAHKP